jgi:membrane protein
MNHPLLDRFKTLLWQERPGLTRSQRLLVLVGRYTFAIVRDLTGGQLSLRAVSLVYTTLLSIVPLLALGFSVLKALGAHNSLEPVLQEFLRPLGPQAGEIATHVVAFVEKIQVGVLGSVGVALLFYTAISLIQKVESSFNFIWRIERLRPIAQRVGEYFGVLMVGPVLVFSALGLTASVLSSDVVTRIASIEPFGGLIFGLTKLIPYVIIIGLFSFMYLFLVNARVRWRAAAIGGLTAGVLWQTSSLAFASFVASSSNYNAIYSSFAIGIFLLIWLHVGWLILLIGCQLAFYVQNPRHLKPAVRPQQMASRDLELLSLLIMSLVAERFAKGESALSEADLIDLIEAPPEEVSVVTEKLLDAGYLVEASGARTTLMPGRDLDSVRLGDFWRHIRSNPQNLRLHGASARRVSSIIDRAEAAFDKEVSDRTLRSLLESPAHATKPSSDIPSNIP